MLQDIDGSSFEGTNLEDWTDLINWLVDTAQEMNPMGMTELESLNHEISHDQGQLKCQFFVAGSNNKFEDFSVSGICQFACKKNDECDCPCGEAFSFKVSAKGTYGNYYYGWGIEFTEGPSLSVLKRKKQKK